MRTTTLQNAALVLLLIGGAGRLDAQQQGTHPGTPPEAVFGPRSAEVEPYGVPVAPAMYLVNFLLLYFSSPDLAANMPAYRAALPPQVYECLAEDPYACPYPDLAKYFAEQALERAGSRNRNTFWPSSCQTNPKWEALAPPVYRQPDQINQPLGRKKADRLARLLGIVPEIVLTPEQYRCQRGTPPLDPARKTILICSRNVTNSTGNAIVPLSSYGLSLNDEGDVRSDCAPGAPCLEFNQLAVDGSLWRIADECDFEPKLLRLFKETPLFELVADGVACQGDWVPSCIVETTYPGTGPRSDR